MDDPKSVADRAGARREIEKKKQFYISQLKEEEVQNRLLVNKRNRVVKPGEKRNKEEKRAVRRDAQNEAWLVNREREYEYAQFEMPPERNAKYHKGIRKEQIKQENYSRARGMK
jgi:hypothetical protein